METVQMLQRKKWDTRITSNENLLSSFFRLDYEEKQHQYDEQIGHIKKLERTMMGEGAHYQQLLKRYYELCDELANAQTALKRLKQQQHHHHHDQLSM